MVTSKKAVNVYTEQEVQSQRFLQLLRMRSLQLFACAIAVIWLLSMMSYSPLDLAFSTAGDGLGVIHNWLGALGAWIADVSFVLLGKSAWIALGLLALACWRYRGRIRRLQAPLELRAVESEAPSDNLLSLSALLLLVSSCALEWSRLYHLEAGLPGTSGGIVGFLIGQAAQTQLGFHPAALVWIVLWFASLSWVLRFSWLNVTEGMGGWLLEKIDAYRYRQEVAQDQAMGNSALRARAQQRREPLLGADTLSNPLETNQDTRSAQSITAKNPYDSYDADRDDSGEDFADSGYEPAWATGAGAPSPSAEFTPSLPVQVQPSKRTLRERQTPLFGGETLLPPLHLLDPAPAVQETVSAETLSLVGKLIERKLKDFGVTVTVVAAAPGPVITRYEIDPAVGVKGSQIVGLSKDLARSLSLTSIRVIETIPGKNYMALELPNARRQTISLSEILGSRIYDESKSKLTMALGKDIIGNPFVADLGKMPHVLVAGTTGSGKSVGINAMILSLLYKATADEVRLLLIDPKMLEMSVYEGIPHLLCPVVTDMRQAAHGLNWCVAEMERRYKLMSKLGVRNLAGYNSKIEESSEREETIPNPFSLNPEAPEPLEKMPQIVIVIDELADLMMVVGKKIEELIARLAQKARAAGIHLILATQRPSVDVITGLIKANVPTRIAFQVSSKIDSRTILDQMGAESLLGMGDMLYMPVGSGLPTRVHGAFVSDEEVHRIVAHLKTTGSANYIEGILEGEGIEDENTGAGAGASAQGTGGEKDSLYDQTVALVIESKQSSISSVQRKLNIGYNRAARMIEDMEKSGILSKPNHKGQREILAPKQH